MKSYDEVKEQYAKLNARYERLLEEVAFDGVSPAELESVNKQRAACAELLQLRLYRPLFGDANK